MFHLRQEFYKGLLEAIENFQERVESSVNGQLAEEKWEAKVITLALTVLFLVPS